MTIQNKNDAKKNFKGVRNPTGFMISEFPRGTRVKMLMAYNGSYKGWSGFVDYISGVSVAINFESPKQKKGVTIPIEWILKQERKAIERVGPKGKQPRAPESCKHNRQIGVDDLEVCFDCGETLGHIDAETGFNEEYTTEEYVVDDEGNVISPESQSGIEYVVERSTYGIDANKEGKIVPKYRHIVKSSEDPVQQLMDILIHDPEIKPKIDQSVFNDISKMQTSLLDSGIDGHDSNVRNAIVVARMLFFLNDLNPNYIDEDLIIRCRSENTHIFNNQAFLTSVAKIYGFVKRVYSTPNPVEESKMINLRNEKISIMLGLEKKVPKIGIKKFAEKRKESLDEIKNLRKEIKNLDKNIKNMYQEIMSAETLVANFVTSFKKNGLKLKKYETQRIPIQVEKAVKKNNNTPSPITHFQMIPFDDSDFDESYRAKLVSTAAKKVVQSLRNIPKLIKPKEIAQQVFRLVGINPNPKEMVIIKKAIIKDLFGKSPDVNVTTTTTVKDPNFYDPNQVICYGAGSNLDFAFE